jgi:hypothetical protein
MASRDLIETIQIAALREKLQPTLDGGFRKIQRWFSQTFATPLETVESYPIEYVLLHYFEDRYESLKEHEIQDLVKELILEPKERAQLEAQRAMEDEEFAKLTEELAKQQLAKVQIPKTNTLPKANKPESFAQDLIIEHVDTLEFEE